MENYVINDDAAGEALRALGAQADAGELPGSTAASEVEQPTGAETTETDESAEGAEKKPADGADKPADGKQDKPAAGKEPSAYEKAQQKRQKEEERKSKSWEELNAAKEEHRRKVEAWERERAQRQPAKPGPIRDERGYSAADYDKVAKDFEDDNNPEMAEEARKTAATLRQKEGEATQNAGREQFHSAWRGDMEQTLKANPVFSKADSPEAKELHQLFTENPEFSHIPNGFSKAVGILQLRHEAGKIPGLVERAEKAEKEVERLTKLTSINGGGPGAPPAGPKPFEQMSEAEQRSFLQREAAQADGTFGG